MWQDSTRVTVATPAWKVFLRMTIYSSFLLFAPSFNSRTLFRISGSTSHSPLLTSTLSFIATNYFTTVWLQNGPAWIACLQSLHGFCLFFSSVGCTKLWIWVFCPQWNLTFSSVYSVDTRIFLFILGLVPLNEIYSIIIFLS